MARDGQVWVVRVGTRGSRLARWQADWVARRLLACHPEITVSITEIRTLGDRDRNSPLAAIGGQGLFTKEIQHALLEGVIDVAVHSLKDLPTVVSPDLLLASVPPREAEADALIAPRFGRLEDLPSGARVGTGSLRRRAQLLSLRPDLEVVGVRGNVETRLRQAVEGQLDAVVLAEAGLVRLGLEGSITDRLGPPRFLPAVGQGALGIECRAADADTRRLLAALDSVETHAAVRAERSLLAELQGGCSIPLAAWGRMTEGGLALDAAVFHPDGKERMDVSRLGSREGPEDLGREVAAELRSKGAERLLAERGHRDPGS